MDPLDKNQAMSSKARKLLDPSKGDTVDTHPMRTSRKASIPYYCEDIDDEDASLDDTEQKESAEPSNSSSPEMLDMEVAEDYSMEQAAEEEPEPPPSVSTTSTSKDMSYISSSLSSDNRGSQTTLDLPPLDQYQAMTIPATAKLSVYNTRVPFSFLTGFILSLYIAATAGLSFGFNTLVYILPFLHDLKASLVSDSKLGFPIVAFTHWMLSLLLLATGIAYLVYYVVSLFIKWPVQLSRFGDVYGYRWNRGVEEIAPITEHPGLMVSNISLIVLTLCSLLSAGMLLGSLVFAHHVLQPILSEYQISLFRILLSSVLASMRAIRPALFLVSASLFIFGGILVMLMVFSHMLATVLSSRKSKSVPLSMQSVRWTVIVLYALGALTLCCVLFWPPSAVEGPTAKRVLIVSKEFNATSVDGYLFLDPSISADVSVAYGKERGAVKARTFYSYANGHFSSSGDDVVFEPEAIILSSFDAKVKPLLYSHVYYMDQKHLEIEPGVAVGYSVNAVYAVLALKLVVCCILCFYLYKNR